MGDESFHRYRYDAEKEIGVLYFLHGFADHLGRWDQWKDFLLSRNVSFYGHDQQGHGKTTLGLRVGCLS